MDERTLRDEQFYAAVRQRVVADPAVDFGDRPALRRAVARALAGEGVILQPAGWARLVRDLVNRLEAEASVHPVGRPAGTLDGFEPVYV